MNASQNFNHPPYVGWHKRYQFYLGSMTTGIIAKHAEKDETERRLFEHGFLTFCEANSQSVPRHETHLFCGGGAMYIGPFCMAGTLAATCAFVSACCGIEARASAISLSETPKDVFYRSSRKILPALSKTNMRFLPPFSQERPSTPQLFHEYQRWVDRKSMTSSATTHRQANSRPNPKPYTNG